MEGMEEGIIARKVIMVSTLLRYKTILILIRIKSSIGIKEGLMEEDGRERE